MTAGQHEEHDAGRRVAVELWGAADTVGAGAPSAAVVLLERALALLAPGDPDRGEVELRLLRSLGWAGELDRAVSLAEHLMSHADPAIREAAFGELARTRFFQGRAAEVAADVRERMGVGGAAAAADGDLSRLAELALLLLFALDLDQATELAEEVVGAPSAPAEAEVVANQVLAWAHAVRGRIPDAVAAGERAVRVADAVPAEHLHRYGPHYFLAVVHDAVGDAASARAHLRAGLARGHPVGLLGVSAADHAIAAVVDFRAGAWDAAVGEAEAQIERAAERGVRLSVLWAQAVRAQIALHRGDLAVAAAEIARGDEALATGAPPLGLEWLLWSKALLCEANGDDDPAIDLLAAVVDLAAEVDACLTVVLVATDLARLVRRRGDAARGDPARLEMLGRWCRVGAERSGGAPVLVAKALLCEGRPVEAADLLRGTDRPFERAQAAELAAVDLASRGHLEQARSRIDEALLVWEDLRAERCADVTAAVAAQHGIETRRRARPAAVAGWASLTATERTVASLVADGLTNAEVAARMGNSRRTVEAHLRQVFVKLEITSRMALVSRVLGDGAPRP